MNEKVALENALAAAWCGIRAICTMKHVGLNVAADPLMTSAYTGVTGGLVIMSADDPFAHSSQNEQDTRCHAHFARLPSLDPAGVQEAHDIIRTAFEISEEFRLPVLFRPTTRICHSKGDVELGAVVPSTRKGEFHKDPRQYVVIPAHTRLLHKKLNEKRPRAGRHAGAPRAGLLRSGGAVAGGGSATAGDPWLRAAPPGAGRPRTRLCATRCDPPRRRPAPTSTATISLSATTMARAGTCGTSLCACRPDAVALVGPSGAGKSTIAALLVRFVDPAAGRLTLDSTDLRELRQRDVRAAVTLDSQDAYLFSTTIRENIRLARGPPPATPRSPGHSIRPGPGSGYAACRTVSTRSSAKRARRCRAANGGGSLWPAPSWPARR